MQKLMMIVVSVLSMLSCGCAALASQEVAPLVQGNTAFALDLYQRLKNTDENLFFSPYSISSALAMTYAGAEGETQKEIQKTLHFPSDFKVVCEGFRQIDLSLNTKGINGKEPITLLKSANSIWVQDGAGLLPSYLQVMDHCFLSHLKTVDFVQQTKKAEDEINQWVANQTQDKILNIIQPNDLGSDTRLVLVSAIYLKAPWLSPFNPDATQEAPFYQAPNQSYPVQMMSLTERFSYYKGDSFAMLELPYKYEMKEDPKLSMLILLPDNISDMPKLEAQWTPSNLQEWREKLKFQRVHVNLPKFKIKDRLGLKDILEQMGMKSAFSASADFSGMNGNNTLQISKVTHQSFLEVDEKGTEAAAATAISISLKSVKAPEPPKNFRVDHPFLLLIIDKETQSILFMGKINKI